MGDLYCTCECGHRVRVPASAMGRKGLCIECGCEMVVTEHNTAPASTRELPETDRGYAGPDSGAYDWQRYAAETPSDRERLHGPKQCSSCGAAFRGAWDRYEGPQGPVCHRCANRVQAQAEQPVPNSAPTPFHAPDPEAPPPEPEPDIEVKPWDPADDDRTWGEKLTDFMDGPGPKRVLLGLAMGVVALGVYYTLIAPPEAAAPRPQTAETDAREDGGRTKMGLGLLGPPEELTEGQHIAIRAIVLAVQNLLAFLPFFCALLLTLSTSFGLPGSTTWAGVLHVGASSLLCAFVGFITAFVPLIGGIFYLVFTCVFLLHVYDFGYLNLLKFLILKAILSFAVTPLAALIYGGLAMVLF